MSFYGSESCFMDSAAYEDPFLASTATTELGLAPDQPVPEIAYGMDEDWLQGSGVDNMQNFVAQLFSGNKSVEKPGTSSASVDAPIGPTSTTDKMEGPPSFSWTPEPGPASTATHSSSRKKMNLGVKKMASWDGSIHYCSPNHQKREDPAKDGCSASVITFPIVSRDQSPCMPKLVPLKGVKFSIKGNRPRKQVSMTATAVAAREHRVKKKKEKAELVITCRKLASDFVAAYHEHQKALAEWKKAQKEVLEARDLIENQDFANDVLDHILSAPLPLYVEDAGRPLWKIHRVNPVMDDDGSVSEESNFFLHFKFSGSQVTIDLQPYLEDKELF